MIAGRLTVVAAVAVTVLAGAEAANALIATNTIDELATHKRDGRLVRATGPIACTRGERIAITATVRQAAARARSRWRGRCTGAVQHWRITGRARRGTRFEDGRGRVCAVATTRRAAHVTDTRRWCEPVDLAAVLEER
jgi:hypothetical protein